jgi:hypothetical protein
MNQKMHQMVEVASQIEKTVSAVVERWRDLPEPTLRFRVSADAWSIKEIIGHLIDSASNNHQRFVRLQLTEASPFPTMDKTISTGSESRITRTGHGRNC